MKPPIMQQKPIILLFSLIHRWSLQLFLWSIWTAAVVHTAYYTWHHALLAHRHVPLIGMVMHCSLTGLVGLVVMTCIEMRAEPWRFYEK